MVGLAVFAPSDGFLFSRGSMFATRSAGESLRDPTMEATTVMRVVPRITPHRDADRRFRDHMRQIVAVRGMDQKLDGDEARMTARPWR